MGSVHIPLSPLLNLSGFCITYLIDSTPHAEISPSLLESFYFIAKLGGKQLPVALRRKIGYKFF